MSFRQNVPFERGKFFQHTKEVAKLVGAGFSPLVFNKVFDVIEADLEPRQAPMGWKITPGTNPRVYFNICNHQSLDLLSVLRKGELVPNKCFQGGVKPVYRLVENDVADGADFNTYSGLCKVWVYTNMSPLETLYKNNHIPESVRLIEPVLREHGLHTHFFVGADFEKNSMNVYFPWSPELQTSEWVQSFAAAIGAGSLSMEALRGIMKSCQHTIGIGITFNWDSKLPQRACFYNGSPSEELPALSEESRVLRECMRKHLPTLINDPTYLYNWSIGRAGEFVKIEKDYSGDFWAHVQNAYGLNPEATHLRIECQ